MKLKNIHSEFMNNLEGDSITANHRDTSLFSINMEPCSSVENASAQGYRRLKELFSLSSVSLLLICIIVVQVH